MNRGFLSEKTSAALGDFVTKYLHYPSEIPNVDELQLPKDVHDELRNLIQRYNEIQRREYCTGLYLAAKKFVESYEAND